MFQHRKRKVYDGIQWIIPALVLICQGHASAVTAVADKGKLVLEPPAGIRYQFKGPIGDRVAANVDNWLTRAPLANPGLIEMFRVRDRKPVPKIVPWAGEFVGKYLISAIQARRMSDDPRLDATIKTLIDDFLSTQAEDGYLGPFTKEKRLLANWDLWGHYHAFLALAMWTEETGDSRALEAALRAADLMCDTYLDTDRTPFDAGSTEMNLSVIHGLGRLYRETGNDRYLQLMRVIEKDWEKEGAGDYFRTGLAGVDFYKTPKPRWESLHCLQGMVELYRITGEEDYKTAYLNLWESIRKFDRHNTGGFTTNEGAIGNPYTPGAIETCCTTAWSAMTVDALYLTGDPLVADELELSLWNSILGSQHPSGRWWTYNTPMDGKREASAHTIVFQSRAGTPELNCCSVNAPRGLGMLSEWALLFDADGNLAVNFYGGFSADLDWEDGNRLALRQEGGTPGFAATLILDELDRPTRKKIRLRVPLWSRETSVTVNGEKVDGVWPGGFLDLDREWKKGDRIDVEFDRSVRTWIGDGDARGKASLYVGPYLLAFDQRFNSYDCDEIPTLDASDLKFEKAAKPDGAFPPMLLYDFVGSDGETVRLCDFASAGVKGTEYRSWLPIENAPPANFYILEPKDGATIPAGSYPFEWTGPRANDVATYTFVVSEREDLSNPLVEEAGLTGSRFVLRKVLEPNKTYFWGVRSKNSTAEMLSDGKASSFTIDPSSAKHFIDHPDLMDFREDGLVTGAELAGTGKPTYGYLEKSEGVTAAKGRDGAAEGSVRFDGAGMLRYKVPYFPTDDYTFLAWIRPEKGVPGRLAQVFSAWARGGDDPLRVVIDGEKLFARIEGGGGASTKGAPVAFGEWAHVAVVKRGPSLALYVDGKQFDSTWAPDRLVGTTAEDFALGGNPHHTAPEFYRGLIQDFAFYGKALSDGEVKRAFEKGGVPAP